MRDIGIKKLLELAGCDVTSGKAKVLAEANTSAITSAVSELNKLLAWVDKLEQDDSEYKHALEVVAVRKEAKALLDTLKHLQLIL